jgi:hypothetical protein
MIDAFDLWNSFQSAVNTEQGGWFRPQTDFIQACNDISKNLWNKGRKEAEKSQFWKDNMAPFMKTKNFLVKTPKVHAWFKPDSDYGGFAAARIIVYKGMSITDKNIDEGKCANDNEFVSDTKLSEDYYDNVREYDVELVDDIKWGAMNRHKTKGPTLDKPKMRQVDGGFQILPRGVTVVVLDYYREPKTATYLYTPSPGNEQTGAGDNIIYNPESQPLEWPFNMRDEFLIELGARYGVFTRQEFLYSVSQQSKKTG